MKRPGSSLFPSVSKLVPKEDKFDQTSDAKLASCPQWLSIDSFPNDQPSQINHEEVSAKLNTNYDDEYIEYDHDLFYANPKVTLKKVHKYKGNLESLLKKVRKLRRKAMKDLSRGMPILIDKLDIYKLTFNIDLKGNKSNLQFLKLKKIPNSNIRHFKIKNFLILGQESSSNTFFTKDRFYTVGVAAQPLKQEYDNLAPPLYHKGGTMIPIPNMSDLELNILNESSKEPQDAKNLVLVEVAELNKKVTNDIHDVNSWLKLVDLQRKKLGQDALESVVTECQLSVLAKGISYNPTSEELLLRQLYITYNVSDPQTLRTALDQIVFNFPQKLSFWIIYLNYNQSEFSRLNHLNICNIYNKVFSKIDSLRSDSVRLSQRLTEPQGSKFILRVLAHYSLYLLSSDCSEKLIALLQLLLEYNLTPSSVIDSAKLNKDTIKLYLETFWDSAEPKLGESDACGFGYFLLKALNKRLSSVFEPNCIVQWNEIFDDRALDAASIRSVETNVLYPFNSDSDLSWISLELYRSNRDMIPCKSSNTEEIDDNERFVLFEDISNFMYRFDSSIIYELCLLYLLVLGVPVPHRYCPTLSEHFHDSLIISDFVLQYPQLISQFEMITGGCTLYLRRGLSPIWMHFGTDSILTCSLPYDVTTLVFIRNVFSHLLSIQAWNSSHVQSFSLIWLQFEILIALQSPSIDNSSFLKVIKLGRKLLELQYNRSFPPLWILYSFCLIYSGKTSEYTKTMLKLINSYKSFSETSSLYSYVLFVRFYLETVILNGLVGTNKVDPAELLNFPKKLFEFIFKEITTETEFDPNVYVGSIMRMFNSLKPEYDEIVHSANIALCQFFSIILHDGTLCAIQYFAKLIEWCSCACRIDCIENESAPSYTRKSSMLGHSNNSTKYNVDNPLYILSKLISEQFSIFILHPIVSPTIDHRSLSGVMHKCVCMFPNSSLIQQWYYQYHQSTSIVASFRIFYDKILVESYEANSTTLTGWLFLIYLEISYIDKLIKYQNSTDVINLKNSSSAYRLKSLFERMLKHPNYRFRPLLWRLFMMVEKRVGDAESLKSVFYRSLQHTPWCKELYVDAIYMKILDTQSVVDMMNEKGIRVRLPVEELELLLSDSRKKHVD